jgi:hypothetical protein
MQGGVGSVRDAYSVCTRIEGSQLLRINNIGISRGRTLKQVNRVLNERMQKQGVYYSIDFYDGCL